ncbi:MAG: lptF [Rickettsiaceae bacterium]|jgi:lipopolysaccharide export system permease protein|nr:lptF [Burkholderiales bacterium]MCE3232682.1 lptF [Rickettsiaceae bacterium]
MPTVVITITLTCIIWLTQSLRFIDLIVNKGLDVSTFLYLSLLLVPSLLMVILPIALFIAVLMVYNKLITDSEMIVLKCAGLSRLKLASPALIVSAGVCILVYLISLYFLPASYREFKETQAFIRNNYASLLLQEGVFSTPIRGLTVYIESRGRDGMLNGIFVHDSRDPDKPVTFMAQEGKLVKSDTGPRFDLVNGQRQEIDKMHGNLTVLNFDSYPMDLSLYTKSIQRDTRTPEELYVTELLNPYNFDPKMQKKYLSEGHYRITWPLFTFVLTLIAIAALFSGQLNRRGHWKRILASTIIGGIVIILNFVAKGVATSAPSVAFLMYLNVLIPIAICMHIILTNRIINNIPAVNWLIAAIKPLKKKASS